MKLVIVRHPETNKIAGLAGDPEAMSPEGQEQLAHIIEVGRQERVQAVIHSTLPRTTIAARILAGALSIPCIGQDNLRERNFGDWDNWDWSQIAKILDKLNLTQRYNFVPPNGESWLQMDHRLKESLHAIATLGYDSVAIMTHYGTIRALLPLVRKDPKESTLHLEVASGEVFIETYAT